jgi:hypothetical protein
MLHVRVVSPAVRTRPLTDRLAAAPGVQNVVVRAGAARRPDGDAVQFDVRDAAANPVFRALRELGLDRDGVICVERVDATLTGQAPAAGGRGALRRETAPAFAGSAGPGVRDLSWRSPSTGDAPRSPCSDHGVRGRAL